MDPQRLPDELVVAGRYTHLIDAEVARSVLVGARIPCTLRNQAMVGVVPHLSNAIGGVTLHVEARYAEEARRLLEAAEPAKIQADPRRPEEAELEGDEHDRGLPSARDTQATRAFRCAVLALFLVPVVLNLYSLYLLLTLARAPGSLSATGRRHAALAVGFNLLVAWIPLAIVLGGR